MKVTKHPKKDQWGKLLQRPESVIENIDGIVDDIMNQVRDAGDEALMELTAQIDQVVLPQVSHNISTEPVLLDDQLARSIAVAFQNIHSFHSSQEETSQMVETMPGVICWRKSVPIQKVGLYIPGGSAPLFSSLLMLAIPAKIAGCEEVVICTPPQKDGTLHPVIEYVCGLLEIKKVQLIGGAQAIAAMTYGTESVPKVDKIFGPGNQFVTLAKQRAQQRGVAIDMPAGPSEVLIIADKSANPKFVAADLLSQAEHGPDSQVILLSDAEETINNTLAEVKLQLKDLPRKDIAEASINNSQAILTRDIDEAFEMSNVYAPEHLILAIDQAEDLVRLVQNAGSVFVGHMACESAGDYASGTNHTLPTHGFARAYSGVSLDSFMKKITFQTLSEEGMLNLGPHIENMAEAEALQAHKNAVTVRLNSLKK